MKIINEGRIPEANPLPVWVGLRMSCYLCGTLFELEEGDEVFTSTQRHPSAVKSATCLCPFCSKQITVSFNHIDCSRKPSDASL